MQRVEFLLHFPLLLLRLLQRSVLFGFINKLRNAGFYLVLTIHKLLCSDIIYAWRPKNPSSILRESIDDDEECRRHISGKLQSWSSRCAPFASSERFTFPNGAAIVAINRNHCPFKLLYVYSLFAFDLRSKLPESDSNDSTYGNTSLSARTNKQRVNAQFYCEFNDQLFVVARMTFKFRVLVSSGLDSWTGNEATDVSSIKFLRSLLKVLSKQLKHRRLDLLVHRSNEPKESSMKRRRRCLNTNRHSLCLTNKRWLGSARSFVRGEGKVLERRRCFSTRKFLLRCAVFCVSI